MTYSHEFEIKMLNPALLLIKEKIYLLILANTINGPRFGFFTDQNTRDIIDYMDHLKSLPANQPIDFNLPTDRSQLLQYFYEESKRFLLNFRPLPVNSYIIESNPFNDKTMNLNIEFFNRKDELKKHDNFLTFISRISPSNIQTIAEYFHKITPDPNQIQRNLNFRFFIQTFDSWTEDSFNQLDFLINHRNIGIAVFLNRYNFELGRLREWNNQLQEAGFKIPVYLDDPGLLWNGYSNCLIESLIDFEAFSSISVNHINPAFFKESYDVKSFGNNYHGLIDKVIQDVQYPLDFSIFQSVLRALIKPFRLNYKHYSEDIRFISEDSFKSNTVLNIQKNFESSVDILDFLYFNLLPLHFYHRRSGEPQFIPPYISKVYTAINKKVLSFIIDQLFFEIGESLKGEKPLYLNIQDSQVSYKINPWEKARNIFSAKDMSS